LRNRFIDAVYALSSILVTMMRSTWSAGRLALLTPIGRFVAQAQVHSKTSIPFLWSRSRDSPRYSSAQETCCWPFKDPVARCSEKHIKDSGRRRRLEKSLLIRSRRKQKGSIPGEIFACRPVARDVARPLRAPRRSGRPPRIKEAGHEILENLTCALFPEPLRHSNCSGRGQVLVD
jgi:hypothetical protein